MDFSSIFLAPLRAGRALVTLLGRVTVGIVGVVLMTGGLVLIEPFGFLALGIPLTLVGFICVARAIF